MVIAMMTATAQVIAGVDFVDAQVVVMDMVHLVIAMKDLHMRRKEVNRPVFVLTETATALLLDTGNQQ